MHKSNRFFYLLLFCLAGLFVLGVLKLFGLAFESGEMYPPYSSLRCDPLGTKALYESLALLKPLVVSRNYETFSRLPSGRNTTLFFLGLAGNDLEHTPKKIANILDRFMQEGGRLVIAFAPDGDYPYFSREKTEDDKKNRHKEGDKEQEERCPNDDADECDQENLTSVSLAEHWGLEVKTMEKYNPEEFQTAKRERKGPIPEIIHWHTAFYFDTIDKPWQVVYTLDHKPVMIERPYGQGSLVLAGDSYLFSNEALHKEREPELLIWFMGPNAKIVFDEVHFGIAKQEGVASLIRRFRMQWFLLGFLIIASLFIWKQMMPLVPPSEKEHAWEKNNLAMGFGHSQGLVSLLKRSIGSHAILKTCFDEWSKSLSPGSAKDQRRSEAIKELLMKNITKKHDPIQGYRTIHHILTRKSHT